MKNATGGSDVHHVLDGDHATAARAYFLNKGFNGPWRDRMMSGDTEPARIECLAVPNAFAEHGDAEAERERRKFEKLLESILGNLKLVKRLLQ